MEMSRTEIQAEHSRRLFWVVQTIFSLILAKSLHTFNQCILAPFGDETYVATIGLLFIFGTTLWSWIDFSYTSIVMPYQIDKAGEKCRFVMDLAIVVLYEYLMLSTHNLVGNNSADIGGIFLGVFFIFGMYFASGLLRIWQHGVRASRLGLIFGFGVAYYLLFLVYHCFRDFFPSPAAANVSCLLAAVMLMVIYRLVRAAKRKRVHWVAVDVDGVLADQITGILPEASAAAGRKVEYKDIREWRLPLGDTSIDKLIVKAQDNRRYVTSMPPIDGAQVGVKRLYQKYKISIVTARAPTASEWTKEWLRNNRIFSDEFENAKEGNKQNTAHENAVLIDDYIGNVENFLTESDGYAILLEQPWNHDRKSLETFIRDGRLEVASHWDEIPEMTDRLMSRYLKSRSKA